jgi:hypothetical protein
MEHYLDIPRTTCLYRHCSITKAKTCTTVNGLALRLSQQGSDVTGLVDVEERVSVIR